MHLPHLYSLKKVHKKKKVLNTENMNFYLQVLQTQSTEKQGMSLGEMLLQCFQVPFQKVAFRTSMLIEFFKLLLNLTIFKKYFVLSIWDETFSRNVRILQSFVYHVYLQEIVFHKKKRSKNILHNSTVTVSHSQILCNELLLSFSQ